MALLHEATLTPAKLDLLAAWLPGRPWAAEAAGELEQLGAYRLDDPAGEVGLEGFLLAVGSTILHVPVSYRGAPLEGAAEHLVGTTEHSVLGTRWVYDACGDPVWASVLAETVLAGGTEAEQYFEVDGERVPRASTVTVIGSGTAGTPVPGIDAVSARDDGPTTVVRAGELELVVVHRLGVDATPLTTGVETLTGRWPGGGPAVLATVRPADVPPRTGTR